MKNFLRGGLLGLAFLLAVMFGNLFGRILFDILKYWAIVPIAVGTFALFGWVSYKN